MGKKDKKVNQVQDAPATTEAGSTEPKATKAPKLGYHVSLNGKGYAFAKRDPLKKAHSGVKATVGGEETTVVIIAAREFADNRVWVTLPNGDVGRFLVPKEVDLTGDLVIDVVEGSIDYKREDLRVRPKVERAKKGEAKTAEGTEAAEATEGEAAEA